MGPNCLQRLSADDKIHRWLAEINMQITAWSLGGGGGGGGEKCIFSLLILNRIEII